MTVLLVAVLVGGCGPQGDAGPTPFPLPSGASALALPTQAARPAAGGSVVYGCNPLGPNEPVTMHWDPNSHTVSFSFQPWGQRASNVIVWPHGFSAREYEGRAELVAPDGHVVARSGDTTIELAGLGPEGVCMVNGVIY